MPDRTHGKLLVEVAFESALAVWTLAGELCDAALSLDPFPKPYELIFGRNMGPAVGEITATIFTIIAGISTARTLTNGVQKTIMGDNVNDAFLTYKTEISRNRFLLISVLSLYLQNNQTITSTLKRHFWHHYQRKRILVYKCLPFRIKILHRYLL